MNAIFVGWNQPKVGREHQAQEHFQEFLSYLREQQSRGMIQGFEPALLMAHGGDLNGFVVLKGQPQKLMELMTTDAWRDHVSRATVNMDRFGTVMAAVGDEIPNWMQRFQKFTS